MANDLNELGQPVGELAPDWTPPPRPNGDALVGRYCRVEPLDVRSHCQSLFEANQLDIDGSSWTYLAYGPFWDFDQYLERMVGSAASRDPLFYAIVEQKTGKAVGIASYLRIDPASGSIEIGHLHFSPLLQRTPAATEAIYLMMQQAFDMGYRRLEWKCNALNEPSRRAALRFGLTFEGIFRQALIVKGRNRDTAWYSAIDKEWPAIRSAFVRWLDPANFDNEGKQMAALSALMALKPKDTS